jgi:hypothetical protein
MRTARALAALPLALTALVAFAPVASATPPTRTVEGPGEPEVIPAGLGCSFDVLWDVVGHSFRATTEFADGTVLAIGHGQIELTNLDTGATYTQVSRYRDLGTFDPVTNTFTDEIDGRIAISFWPGDIGPDGIVGGDGLFLRAVGHTRLVVDAATFAYLDFSNDGTLTDLCAILSQ